MVRLVFWVSSLSFVLCFMLATWSRARFFHIGQVEDYLDDPSITLWSRFDAAREGADNIEEVKVVAWINLIHRISFKGTDVLFLDDGGNLEGNLEG